MDSDIKLQAEIYHFDLPLSLPLWTQREKISRRQGFILILSTPDGHRGYGEISPLPGLHSETAYDAGNQLQNLCFQLPDLNQIIDDVKNQTILQHLDLFPSVRFGLESAVIDLLANWKNIAPSQILDLREPCKYIKVNGLITREEDVTKRIEYFIKMGYGTVKIKLGNNPIAADIQKICSLADMLGNSMKLRIDVNRSWTLVQAQEFYNNIDSETIEYIEEPIRDPEKLPVLFESIGMPIALDESINILEEPSDSFNWCKAIILKPALIGSVFKTHQLITAARERNSMAVISDTFQTSIGVTMLANLSSLANGDYIAMGLDTIRWMDDDLLENRVQIENGAIDLSEVNKNRHNIDLSKLDKIV